MKFNNPKEALQFTQKPEQCEILENIFGECVSITGYSAFSRSRPDLLGFPKENVSIKPELLYWQLYR